MKISLRARAQQGHECTRRYLEELVSVRTQSSRHLSLGGPRSSSLTRTTYSAVTLPARPAARLLDGACQRTPPESCRASRSSSTWHVLQ